MDDGYVLPGLNEQWTLGGAKLMEWIAGFCTALIFSEIFLTNVARSMPMLGLVLVGTTFGMATLRKQYPDEERGIRNAAMVAMGMPPPGIPAPASIQPNWSGAPMRGVQENSYYAQLGLVDVFGGQDLMEEDGTRN
jgi:hypothetical protein